MYLCTKENIMHHPEIAIVDPNTLTCLGLKNILEDIIPMATIRVAGGDNQPQLSGVPKLNIYQDEGSLIKDIHQLRQYGHQARKQAADKAMHIEKTEHELSVREIEVLILITKGLINKEIADKLNISLTTVISHRKNITEKLGIKSVSGLTVYAVMNGYIEADRI